MKQNGHSYAGWVNLATFRHRSDAEALKSELENEGMDARLHDDRILQRYWFAVAPRGAFHVQVPATTFQEATESLAATPAAQPLLQKALHCPSCRSTRIEYPAMTRKNMLPTLVAQMLVAVGIAEHEYYCENCHYTWSRAGQKPLTAESAH